jgi:hypothetical protein
MAFTLKYAGYFRHPQTQNEMKQYYASIENEMIIPVKIRGRRKPKQLPNAWDDIASCWVRNWKRFRKT